MTRIPYNWPSWPVSVASSAVAPLVQLALVASFDGQRRSHHARTAGPYSCVSWPVSMVGHTTSSVAQSR